MDIVDFELVSHPKKQKQTWKTLPSMGHLLSELELFFGQPHRVVKGVTKRRANKKTTNLHHPGHIMPSLFDSPGRTFEELVINNYMSPFGTLSLLTHPSSEHDFDNGE